MSFVHLHVHTEYSLLDSSIKIKDLVAKVKKLGMEHVAITDHANLFGVVEFFSLVKDAGLHPIMGAEVYLAPGSRFGREPVSREKRFLWNRVVLLCQNETGYKNLCRLLTYAHLEGFYLRPRIDKELLTQFHEGLIALTAGEHGEVASLLSEGKKEEAESALQWYKELFGDRLYLELKDQGRSVQKNLNLTLIELGKRFDVKVVATNDCHYLNPEDARACRVLRCIRDGTKINEIRGNFEDEELYVKSEAEMLSRFAYFPEAVERTGEVAERCHFSFKFGSYDMPEFPLEGETLEEGLRLLAIEGLEKRLQRKRDKGLFDAGQISRYQERLEWELKTIESMGFAGYFLIVADFIEFAKKNGIPVGPGRGSSAGSLVAYSLFITDIDPIQHALIFERFLNPERVTLPDMDIDFCMDKRDQVIDYVTKKYGEQNVAHIITFGKLQAKAAIKDVGRVYDLAFAEVDRITKLVPPVLNITIEEALQQEPKLKKLYQEDHTVQQVIDTAQALEGICRHASIHAAGVVISNRPMYEYLPLFKGKDGEIITQFDMKSVEKIGLIKFDFLGLKTLTVIAQAVSLIRTNKDPRFDLNDISLDDPAIYALLSEGDTVGIFQLESTGMKDLVSRLKPERFEDIVAVNALYRPGPLGSGMVDDFIARKHGQVEIEYMHPSLKGVLESTYGVILYQEQVMQIANILGKFSLGGADLLRRAMGKKIKEEMDRQREHFINGGVESGLVSKEKAEAIFDLMEKFSKYGFPRSHSAAYALVAYQTAYLKVKYPVEFYASLLTSEMDNSEKVTRIIYDAKAHGIELLPPHVNESMFSFDPKGGSAIRTGLGVIKNVGGASIEEIIACREKLGRFTSLEQLSGAVDLRKVNKKILESLIKAGALDGFGEQRSRMLDKLPTLLVQAQNLQRDRLLGQLRIFNDVASSNENIQNEETWTEKERLKFERETLGFYVSGHPLHQHEKKVKRFMNATSEQIKELPHRSFVTFAAVATELTEKVTRTGDRMAFALVEDLMGPISLIVFANIYKETELLWKADDPLLIRGTVDHAEESCRVIVSEVELLQDLWSRKARAVRFCVDELGVTAEKIEALRDLCAKYQGHCSGSLQVRFKEQGKLVEAILPWAPTFKVNPLDTFIQEAELLLGKGSVECVL